MTDSPSTAAPAAPETPVSTPTGGKIRLAGKIATLGGLTLLLGIVLLMILDLVSERAQRRAQVVQEIASRWGAAQALTGPVLVLPYREIIKLPPDKDGKVETRTVTRRLHVLPETLEVSVRLRDSLRHIGIYEAVVYDADLSLRGAIAAPDLARLGIAPGAINWADAYLAVGMTDLRGIKGPMTVKLGAQSLPLEPGSRSPVIGAGMHAPVKGANAMFGPAEAEATAATGKPVPFTLDFSVSGSQELKIAPAGRRTTVSMASSWPHPKFTGGYLPSTRKIQANGFTANWSVNHVGRDYPQYWYGGETNIRKLKYAIQNSRFGVALYTPVDLYHKAERTVKYGVMFILLILGTIFILEIAVPLRIHVIEYALSGFALCLFYLLVLSLAEIIGFGRAYGAAAVAATGMVTLYLARSLQSRGRMALVGGVQLGVYGYLYVVLQLEDLALLAGTLGLAAALAVLMVVSRKIDWNRLDFLSSTRTGPNPGETGGSGGSRAAEARGMDGKPLADGGNPDPVAP